MKNTKKIIFSIMLIVLTLLLVSCGKKKDTTIQLVTADYSQANLVFESEENVTATNILNQITKDDAYTIKFYKFINGTNPTLFDQKLYDPEIDTVNQTFKLSVAGHSVNIPYLIKGQDKEILAVSLDIKYIKFQKGASAETFIKRVEKNENFTVFKIDSQGNKNKVAYEDLVISGDWSNITEKNKFYEGNGIITIKNGDLDYKLNVRIDGGDDPLTWKTAGWWAKITAWPISWLMSLFAGLLNNSFAFGIVITTIIVRTAAWPIYARSNDMSAKMNLAQPEMQKIQNKYALKKDPQSQQKMQLEMMQVYKKYGLGITGCLLPFLQMPIFMAMFQSVRRISIEGGTFAAKVANTNFFGIDLAINGNIANYVFAALVGITMFLLQKLSTRKPSYMKKTGTQVKTEQQQQSERTMKIMSIVMIAMMTLTAASSTALAFYWIIGNLYSLGQTYITQLLNKKKYLKQHNEAII